jgi:hypothetical protein
MFFLRGRANAAIQRARKKWRRPHPLLYIITQNFQKPTIIEESIKKMTDKEIFDFEKETGVSLYIFFIS